MSDAGRAAGRVTLNIEDHLGLVRGLARKIHRTLPSHFDVHDLISEGTIGLLEAATRFDPHRGFPFARFASGRVYGAILDYVRREAPMGRRAYAAVLAGDATRLRWVGPLDDVHLATLADPLPGPETVACGRAEALRVRATLAVLSPRERAIIVAHFGQDRIYADIATELHVSESRVQQIAVTALRKLRRAWTLTPAVVLRTQPRPRGPRPRTPWTSDVYRERAKAKRLWDAA